MFLIPNSFLIFILLFFYLVKSAMTQQRVEVLEKMLAASKRIRTFLSFAGDISAQLNRF
jgi:hypothetical protein